MRHVSTAAQGLAAVLAACLMASAAHAADPVGVDGVWRNEDGEGLIEVAACATDPAAKCGKIVWMKKPLDERGKPQQDVKNADAALQKRPICGLEVVSGMKPAASGGYDGGLLYDPEEGKSYQGTMTLDGTKLKVTGFIDTPVLGKLSDSESWTRTTEAYVPCAAKK